MRLIDADALKRWLETNKANVNPLDYNTKATYAECITMVEAMETIEAEPVRIDGNTSDGYHTFNELYHHRAVLFSVIVKAFPQKAWKSRKHHDGTMFDGMFIVGIETPEGQATYHYDIKPYWDMFQCTELDYAPKWDGHTAEQAIERIGKLEPVRHGRWKFEFELADSRFYRCSECNRREVLLEEEGVHEDFPYCHCGAKMDLEEEE